MTPGEYADSKRIRILFYRAGLKDSFGIDDLISMWSGLWPGNWGTGPYSHCELMFYDRNFDNEFAKLAHNYRMSNLTCLGYPLRGICYSSATRGKFTGVRFALIDEVLKNKSRWDYIDIDLSEALEQILWDECRKLEGAKYDFLGIFGKTTFFTDFIQSYNRWYCSEVVDYVLTQIGVFNKHNRLSPRAFSRKVVKDWGKLSNLETGKYAK